MCRQFTPPSMFYRPLSYFLFAFDFNYCISNFCSEKSNNIRARRMLSVLIPLKIEEGTQIFFFVLITVENQTFE